MAEFVTTNDLRVIMFVSITDAVAMKESRSEADWLGAISTIYREASESIERSSGRVVKYTSDGVMAAFSDDQAHQAIDAAINLQERIGDLNDDNRIIGWCSIGIAAGRLTRVEWSRGDESQPYEDFVGPVVDRAQGLCTVASAKAIFVDAEAIAAAMMPRVQSRVGLALRRTPKEYRGDPQQIRVPGVTELVEYHEIFWDRTLYGVKSETVSRAVKSAVRPEVREGAAAGNALAGVVRRWDPEKRQGFLLSGDEFFYVDARFLAEGQELRPSGTVFFVPRDPLTPGKNRVAGSVIQLGGQVVGTVTYLTAKGYGFLRLGDSYGTNMNLFLYLGTDGQELRQGDRVRCTVSQNDRGAAAVDPVQI